MTLRRRLEPWLLLVVAAVPPLVVLWALRSSFIPGRAHLSPAVALAASCARALSSAAPGPVVQRATPAELEAAVQRGLPALRALAQRYPGDPAVSVAVARGAVTGRELDLALEAMRRALELEPGIVKDGKAAGALWRLAQSDVSERAVLLIEGSGPRGGDILFDLTTTSAVKTSVRANAREALARLRQVVPVEPDTRVAAALLFAARCEERRALLDAAVVDGGQRTLRLLEEYARGRGCEGGDDARCGACLRGDAAFTAAIVQLKTRVSR